MLLLPRVIVHFLINIDCGCESGQEIVFSDYKPPHRPPKTPISTHRSIVSLCSLHWGRLIAPRIYQANNTKESLVRGRLPRNGDRRELLHPKFIGRTYARQIFVARVAEGYWGGSWWWWEGIAEIRKQAKKWSRKTKINYTIRPRVITPEEGNERRAIVCTLVTRGPPSHTRSHVGCPTLWETCNYRKYRAFVWYEKTSSSKLRR